MKERLFIGLAVVGLAVIAGVLVSQSRRQVFVYHGKPIDAWALQVYATDPKASDEARDALKAMGPKAVPELVRLLERRDPSFRRLAWYVAPKLPSRVRQILLRKVKPLETANPRGAAARSLGLIGPEARAAIPALDWAMRGGERPVFLEAAGALAAIGKDSAPCLVAALEDKEPQVRLAAARSLAALGPEAEPAIPALTRGLDDQDGEVRAAAGYALSKMRKPGLTALESAIDSGSSKAREAAAKALPRFYPSRRELVPSLLKMARDEAPATRRQAIQVLGTILMPDVAILIAYTNALQDPAVEVRLEAVKALSEAGFKARPALPAMIACLQDESSQVRASAARALGKMGGRAKAAIPELTRLLEDKDERVRDAAKTALEKLEAEIVK